MEPTRLLRPWNFPGKSTGVGCHFLFQEISPTQGLNPGLPHCRQMFYRLSHQGSPKKIKKYGTLHEFACHLSLEVYKYLYYIIGFPGGSDDKESACNAGDLSSIPGLGRAPEGGYGNPL